MKQRITSLRLLLVFIGIVFTARLFFVQIINGDSYIAQAQSEQLKKYEIAAERGRLYFLDFNGEKVPAVLNMTLKTLYADPRYIKDPTEAALQLVSIIGGDVNKLRDQLSQPDRAYVVLAKKLNIEKADAIEKLSLPGIGLQEASYRSYPEGTLGAQLLGFVNDDGIGQYGVEGALNELLTGEAGLLNAVTDVNGIPLTTSDDAIIKNAVDGKDVILTIDRNLQRYVEEALERGVKTAEGKSGSVIVMNPRNGAILAMANFPSYDPAKFFETTDQGIFLNAVVSTPYEVGSVMKALTMSAGLNEQVVAERSTYYDTGFAQVEDRRIENAIAIAAGERDMTEVIKQSLNTGVVHVLRELGGGEINQQSREQLYRYFFEKFGFGYTTGVEQAAEAQGLIYSPNEPEGNNVRYANMTFGQGMTVTMVQLAAAYSSIVNGGNYYKPYIVHAIEDKISGEANITQPTLLRSGVITAETSQAIRRMMEEGVKLAGAQAGYQAQYRIGGKTGTAQKLQENGAYSDSLEIGTFAGFGATNEVQYVIITKIDEPSIPGFAGSVAARPIFADISNWLINYYRIEPVQ